MMLGGDLASTENDRRAWCLQLAAIESMRILTIAPAAVEDWAATRQIFKLALDVAVADHAAKAPIPYYGWGDNPDIRWVTTDFSVHGRWRITAISTGP